VKARKGSVTPSRLRKKKPPPLPVAAAIALLPELAAAAEPRWAAQFDHTLPLALCALNAARLELGLAVVVVARRAPNGAILVAHFVLDLLACGLTDCYGEAYGPAEFDAYVADLDERVPLESCDPSFAERLVREAIALGETHGVCQCEAFAYWGRLLAPADRPASPTLSSLFGRHGRPLAVAELLPLRPRLAGLGEDQGEIRCVVRVESPREH